MEVPNKTSPPASQPPVQTPPAAPVPLATAPLPPTNNSHIFSKTVLLGALLAVIAIGGGAAAYAFVQKIGPFAQFPYTEDTIVQGVLKSFADLKSVTYNFSVSVKVDPREKGAQPFTIAHSNEAELREQYQNDYDRAHAISSLLSELGRYGYSTYPASIQDVAAGYSARASKYNSAVSVVDPKTQVPYEYRVIGNGFGYQITATFETQAAIEAIRRSYNAASTTVINGQTVTFRGDAKLRPYFYLSSEPPKPYLVQLGESARLLPAEFSIAGAVMGSISLDDSSRWKFNLSGEGAFGDFTYALDIDALKKDTDYYIRINKIPSILLASISSLKGQWIHIDSAATTSASSYRSSLSRYANYFPDIEKQYRDSREKMQEFYKKMLQVAVDVHLVAFKDAPQSDRIDGALVYRYNLMLRKEAILPFYQKLSELATHDPQLSRSRFFNDQGVIEYLKSDEFDQVFDYLNKYTNVTWWVDPQGNVVQSELLLNVIPPDSAAQLTDKQVDVLFRTVISDRNKKVQVDAPKDFKEIDALVDEYQDNRYNYAPGSTDAIKAYLVEARSSGGYSWSVSNESGKTFGIFALGPCTQKVGTVFENKAMHTSLVKAAGGDASKATCAASTQAYAVSVPLSTAGYSWCVDSSGDSRQIKGILKGVTCK